MTLLAVFMCVLWGVCAYLLGSVSFGDMVARIVGIPIRERGTGNPGAANVFREMGLGYSALVLALDFLKGAAAMAPALFADIPVWAGFAGAAGVLAGHFLPAFWKFQGGTGMVVAMGVCAVVSPVGAALAAPAALVALALRRSAALCGAVGFVICGAVGWISADDAWAAALIAASACAVAVKSRIQYSW